MSKLIVGCGYLGRRVAERWLSAGEEVFALTRSLQRATVWQKEGLRPLVGDVASPGASPPLPAAETLLYAVGYDRSAESSIEQVYAGGLLRVLEALPAEPQRIIYVSSTGVYGQNEGELVDETSPCRPLRAGGKASLAAEQTLRDHKLGDRGVVLRLAGIYGPGRVPRRADLKAGRPLAAPAEGFLNLIHVDDAVEVVLAAERRAKPPALFTVSDGRPVVRAEYYRHLARLIHAPEPQFTDPPPDSPAAARARTDKRISNRRMLHELGVRLRYPSYREGLAGILAEEDQNG